MKPRILSPSLLLALGALTAPLVAADRLSSDSTATAPDAAQRTLMITVVEPSSRRMANAELYNRLARIFPAVFESRGWPVKIEVERFGANNPAYDLELRVFLQEIREENPNDLTFRSWMNLNDAGTKHDLGVILYRHYPRPGQQMDEVLDNVLRGAALEAAKKIEPVLFPNLRNDRKRS